MKNKRINLLLILCFSLIFFITSFDCAYAAEENGSLNIILTYERQAIDGAEFSVYQVAKWNEKESTFTPKISIFFSMAIIAPEEANATVPINSKIKINSSIPQIPPYQISVFLCYD